MAKTIFRFSNNQGNLFEIKMSDQHIQQLERNSIFEVNRKRRTIKSDLFNKMFASNSPVQTLYSNNYTCNVCRKIESFLIKNSKVYCVSCYESFAANKAETVTVLNPVHPIIEEKFLNLASNNNKKTGKSIKKVKKATDSADAISKIINDETLVVSDTHASRLAKFQKRLEIAKDANQKAVKEETVVEIITPEPKTIYNLQDTFHLNSLQLMMNRMEDFAQRLVKLTKRHQYNATFSFHLLNTLSKYTGDFANIGIDVSKDETRNDYLFEKIFLNLSYDGKYQTFYKMVHEKIILDNVSKNKLTTVQSQLEAVFKHDCNCNVCGTKLTKKNFVNLLNRDEVAVSITNVIQTCDECQRDLANNSLLEVIAMNELAKKPVKLSVTAKIHALTQYNYLFKKFNNFIQKEAFLNLQQEFNIYYNLYLIQILRKVDLTQRIKNSIFNVQVFKAVIDDFITKISSVAS